MNTLLNMPGFTARASLYRSSVQYQTDRQMNKSSAKRTGAVYPSEEMQGEEVIEVHGCAPGYIEVGSGSDAFCTPGPDLWWDGLGGGGTWPPDVPPGGGGGGGGGPASVPPDIVKDCLLVGGKYGEKYCGGIGGPSCCKTCAQTVCQQKKCKETERCDPNLLNGAKEAQCTICCPDRPGCKDGLTVKRSVSSRGLISGLKGVVAL